MGQKTWVLKRDMIPSLITTKEVNLSYDGWSRSQRKVMAVTLKGLTTVKNALGSELVANYVPFGVYECPAFMDADNMQKLLENICDDIFKISKLVVTSTTTDSDSTTLLAAKNLMEKLEEVVSEYEQVNLVDSDDEEESEEEDENDNQDTNMVTQHGDADQSKNTLNFNEVDNIDKDNDKEREIEEKQLEMAEKFLDIHKTSIDNKGNIDDDDEYDTDEPLYAATLIGMEDSDENVISGQNVNKCCTHQISNCVKDPWGYSRYAR